MARDGSGTYSHPAGTTAVSGTAIDSSDYNGMLSDVADALNDIRIANLSDTSAFAKTLLDDTTAGAVLTTLGITAFAQTILDDASAAAVITTLGLASVYQPLDATLTALAALSTAADKMIYATGSDTFATADLSSFARTILDDANGAAVQTTIGITAAAQTVLDDTTVAAMVTTLAGGNDFLRDSDLGKATAYIDAASMLLPVTNAPALNQEETATNARNFLQLLFDPSTEESASFQFAMPQNWDESDAEFRVWYQSPDALGNVVRWAIKVDANSSTSDMDGGWSSEAAVNHTSTSTADALNVTAWTTFTFNSASANRLVIFKIYRDVTDAADTTTVDVALLGVEIRYNTNALNDN